MFPSPGGVHGFLGRLAGNTFASNPDRDPVSQLLLVPGHLLPSSGRTAILHQCNLKS
jgi:hypothetical protein